VRELLARRVVAQVVAQGPSELIAARPLLEAAVAQALQTPPLQPVVCEAAVNAHRLLFVADRDSLVLDLADAGVVLVDGLRVLAPELAGRLPAELRPGLIELSERPFAAEPLRIAERVRVVAPLTLGLAVVLLVAVFVVAADRRAALARAGAAVAASASAVVVAWWGVRAALLVRLDDDELRPGPRPPSTPWPATCSHSPWGATAGGSSSHSRRSPRARRWARASACPRWPALRPPSLAPGRAASFAARRC
jgi:hypothetical protein